MWSEEQKEKCRSIDSPFEMTYYIKKKFHFSHKYYRIADYAWTLDLFSLYSLYHCYYYCCLSIVVILFSLFFWLSLRLDIYTCVCVQVEKDWFWSNKHQLDDIELTASKMKSTISNSSTRGQQQIATSIAAAVSTRRVEGMRISPARSRPKPRSNKIL